jgi:hypothetical protein
MQDKDGDNALHITLCVHRQQLPGVRYFVMFQQCFMIVFSVYLAIYYFLNEIRISLTIYLIKVIIYKPVAEKYI